MENEEEIEELKEGIIDLVQDCCDTTTGIVNLSVLDIYLDDFLKEKLSK